MGTEPLATAAAPGFSADAWFLIVLGTVVALVVIDRLLLMAEARGHIYYRKRKASPGSVGAAAMEIQAMLEPSGRHAVVEQRRVRTEADDEGGPPIPEGEPGSPSGTPSPIAPCSLTDSRPHRSPPAIVRLMARIAARFDGS
jgi:hypothetical protein